MNRRQLLRRIATLPFLAHLPAPAQTKPVPQSRPERYYRVGILRATPAPEPSMEAFRTAIQNLSRGSGITVLLDTRWADGRPERLGALATDLVTRQKMDLLVADGVGAVLAAKEATKSLPIVMVDVDEPVAMGVVSDLARPNGTVTGIGILSAEPGRARLNLLREIDPNARRFAVLTNPGNPTHAVMAKELAVAASNMGGSMHVAVATSSPGLEGAILSMLNETCSAFVVLPDATFFNARKRIIHLSAQHKLPALYDQKEAVIDGGLISYGPSHAEMYRRAAAYVDRLARGAIPGELAVEQPAKYELFVNRRTAQSLGFVLPESLLRRADQVVQ